MKSLETIEFSEIKLGKSSINFAERQLKLYTELAEEHPENDYYKRTRLELAGQLEKDKEALLRASL